MSMDLYISTIRNINLLYFFQFSHAVTLFLLCEQNNTQKSAHISYINEEIPVQLSEVVLNAIGFVQYLKRKKGKRKRNKEVGGFIDYTSTRLTKDPE